MDLVDAMRLLLGLDFIFASNIWRGFLAGLDGLDGLNMLRYPLCCVLATEHLLDMRIEATECRDMVYFHKYKERDGLRDLSCRHPVLNPGLNVESDGVNTTDILNTTGSIHPFPHRLI